MAQPAERLTADVYLRRAHQLIDQVNDAISEFREQAIAHDQQIERDQPFLLGMVNAYRGSRGLTHKKAEYLNDLQLADREIDQAVRLDPDAMIETPQGGFGALQLRAYIHRIKGQLEMIVGSPENALVFLNNANQLMELADTHYMIGLIYEAKYLPSQALHHFEKCLELEPAGELSAAALREADAMRSYRKQFRGSWGMLLLLFVLFFPAAFIYFFVQRK